MPIIQAGSVNNTALIVPDLYVEIVPPQNLILNGVPTNVLGVVGTSTWGPVSTPVIMGSMLDYYANFGPIMPRKFDMGTQLAAAVQQGAQDFRGVRVTDGTDTFASATVPGTALTITALYTGTLGNQIAVTLQPGSQQASWRLTATLPGIQPEVFDNITGSGAAFWLSLASAVNTGAGVQRSASRLITIQPNGNTSTPTSFSLTLGSAASGSDGAAGVTSTRLVGQDTATRTGMYALRGQKCGLALLADADDSGTWTNQAGFSLSEGLYMILTGPAGDTISNAIAVKQSVGLDCYSTKLMFGDWLWWSDQANGLIRLVSPQGFTAGRLANLSPEQSSLNKPLYGVIGSQGSGQPQSGETLAYSSAALSALFSGGIDVISNPQPGGSYWGVRGGLNSSSNVATNGDNYPRLTNYISQSLSAGMGQYVGQVITVALFQNIRGTLLSFLQNMLNQGLLGSASGALPYSVICDISNNPPSRTGLGYVQANVQIQYQSINDVFIISLEGGQTVQVAMQTLPAGQPAQ
jgi:phage tail sheath protein FI